MTPHTINRRVLLGAPLMLSLASASARRSLGADSASAQLAALERDSGGRLGVAAIDTTQGATILHRADERFAFCSTFKVIAASAILQRGTTQHDLLQRHIRYQKRDIVPYSPITAQHVGEGMSLGDICAAALQYSDNTAANLMIRLLGGPAGVTDFARRIGDRTFRLDRWETALNSAIPGDPRDTTTPAAMMQTLRNLTLGNALPPPQRTQLIDWMRGNTTGDKRIRAGVPHGWTVADKTGSGDRGSTNDIGVLWPPGKAPIVLVLYYTGSGPNAPLRDDVLADATRIVVAGLSGG